VRGLHLHYRDGARLALCALRIGKPDSIHLQAARAAVFHHEVIESGYDCAFDPNDLPIERLGTFEDRANGCVDGLGINRGGTSTSEKDEGKDTFH
jgi:hypothetical protein